MTSVSNVDNRSFRFDKVGLVYHAPHDGSWRNSYAQVPAVIDLGDRLRVYFSVRPPKDENGMFRSTMCWVDVAREDPTKVIAVAQRPFVEYGAPGTFDEHGVMPSCANWNGDVLRLYYCGWMRLVGVPYSMGIGVLESRDRGQTFERLGEGPLFGRTLREPYLEGGPYVVSHDGVWHMWYTSGTGWVDNEALYVIKYAYSKDGIEWIRDGEPVIKSTVDHECQARPTVARIGSRWHMWFSYRYGLEFRNAQRGYRMGYAWSDDLKTWHRDDALAGIDVSATGWDSEMICYPCVFVVDGDVYMYYNGNNFGENGFGCAKLIR